MSDEIEIKTAQDVINQINFACGELTRMGVCNSGARSDFCQTAVDRNNALVRMRFTPEDERYKQTGMILQSWVLADQETSTNFEMLGYELDNRKKHLEEVRDALVELWNAKNEEHKKIQRHAELETKQMKAALDLAQQRLREHALHNSEVREAVWAITGGKCFYCEVELMRCLGEEQDRSRCFHVDHLVAKANGGPDHLSNYVPACETCNISKGSKSYVEFIALRKAKAPQLTVIEGGAVA